MIQPAPTLETVLVAYQRALVAKVQLVELAAWGSSTTRLLHMSVTAHVELERAYVVAAVERRKREGSG